MNHIIINNLNQCCGCRSCENICPKKAIKMVENEEGFLYPIVDEDKCINCGLCAKICPWLNKIKRDKYYDTPICYAAKSKDKHIQRKSSSGGVFGILATEIIKQNGIVIGSKMDSSHRVSHVLIDNLDDLPDIMGSKYVYSDLNSIFIEIRKLLNEKKVILFSGVPCQISALLNFLQKKYENLITVEVICHGTPSQKLFDKYISYLEDKNKAKLVEYKFRSKEAANWGTFKALAKFKMSKNNKIVTFEKKINADFDPYYWSFLKCKNYRESCYVCKFANVERNADITLGDFWGVESITPNMIDYDGVSIVIINTENGKKIFDSIYEKFDCSEVDYKKIQENNLQLKEPSKRTTDRNTWYNGFNDDNFIRNIKIKKNIKSYIKIIVPQKLKFYVKKLFSKK